jgi:hypothetical protein
MVGDVVSIMPSIKSRTYGIYTPENLPMSLLNTG